MSIEEEVTSFVAKCGPYRVTESDVLNELKYRSSWNLVHQALARKAEQELIESHSIELTDEQVYEFMDTFRELNGLYSEEEIDSWLRLCNLGDDEFFEFCRHEASKKVLKDKLISDDMVSELFVYKKLELEAVELYHILVSDLDTAREILAQTREGETFFDMAHKYSTDEETRKTCGYMGLVTRSNLRAEVAGNVFGAKKGAILGPFKGTSGYHLYLVDALVPAQLDDITREMLKDQLFTDLIASRVRFADVEYQGTTCV